MIGGNRARALTAPSRVEQDVDVTGAPVPEEGFAAFDGATKAPTHGGQWLGPVLAAAAVFAWFAGTGYVLAPVFQRGLEPIALVQLIAALCVPPALIGILYLLSLRTSRAEARRFGSTASAMRAEAAALERVISTLEGRIAAQRDTLADQAEMLGALTEQTVERVDSSAGEVAAQARSFNASARMLEHAAGEAERRVSVVLASLPKAVDELRAVAERAEAAGLLASERAAGLDAQLSALTQRGREADHVAGGAAERLAAHLARMEATSQTAGARLEQVTSEMSEAVDAVLDRAAGAVDEARKGIATQGEAILAMLSASQAALDRAGRDTAEVLGERMAAVEESIGRVGARLAEEQARGDMLLSGLSAGVERLDRDWDVLHQASSERADALAGSISALQGSMAAMAEAMQGGNDLARKVIGTSEDLLTALDASAREIDETLPQALSRLDSRVSATRELLAGTKPELLALVSAAETTHDAIEAIADVITQQRGALTNAQEALADTLAHTGEQAQQLGAVVDESIASTQRFAESAAPQLVEALVRVRETSHAAADNAREALAEIVPSVGRALEEASATALKRAVDGSVRRQLVELAETSEAAIHAATRASERLTQQMLTLAETVTQVDAQMAESREAHEKADSDQFARRVSLLVEALNSASIDIAKAFSAEVTDSAWAAYLKGDRAVFTRRAVRLIEPGDVREITRLYDSDSNFRDSVNRYIHDFEAMLRQILGLRDGSSFGVTLLSSDMGKLYVVLAQAIERLRS
jgi:hypothetical protein